MPAQFVLDFYQTMEQLGIRIWLDGGWGVDALLGEQTRQHGDLDIVIQLSDLPMLRSLLEARGYRDKRRDDTSAWNFVLADDLGHEIDVHVIVLDETGNGIYGPFENGQLYPASSLSGTGEVLGYMVRCISAADMVQFHLGYELDETDYHDVAAFCSKYGIKLPPEYERFANERD